MMLTVIREPGGKAETVTNVKTVHGVLNRLKLKSSQVLVIRGDELLTPDRPVISQETLIVRNVRSSG